MWRLSFSVAGSGSFTACRLVLAIALLFGLVFPATADTIVLKNGRRIFALTVVEEGDKVKYQTSAGELSLPKSIVDHIEKGGALPDSAAAAAANLAITPPPMAPGKSRGVG